MTIAQLELAAQVSDPGTKFLAHFAAFIAGIGAAFSSVTGPAGFFQYRSLLRRAKGS